MQAQVRVVPKGRPYAHLVHNGLLSTSCPKLRHLSTFKSLATKKSVGAKGYWQLKEHAMAALDRAERKLGIQKPDDWNSVSLEDLKQVDNFPSGMTKTRLAQWLTAKYPEHRWDQIFLLKGRFAKQRRLETAVAALFSDQTISINARREANLINPATGEYMELDIYIPSLRLAFEYQEKHHYVTSDEIYNTLEDIKQRDSIKKQLAADNNITLIVVPFWWDETTDSLIATIKQVRPDLFPTHDTAHAQPIPEEMPIQYQMMLKKETVHIEGIGEPSNATFFTMSSIDPTNWWLFEKYDGIRGFWNPEKRMFFSRQGNQLQMPKEVIDDMPTDLFLDGEIWFGRESFQEAMKIATRADRNSIDWSKCKYMVYDIPNLTGTYKQRYDTLLERIKGHKFIEVAEKVECTGVAHMERLFQDIVDKGGEGIILRNPSSPIEPGRAAGYLKHKKYRDAEARIIARTNDQWECELPNGVRFSAVASTKEFVNRWNPKIGDIVTFKHRGFLLATKKPKLAILHRIRTDITWETVMANWKEKKEPSSVPYHNNTIKRIPKQFWSDLANRQAFFRQLASQKGFDLLSPEGWSTITKSHLLELQANGLLQLFGGSLKEALVNTFPELKDKAWPMIKQQQRERKV